MALAYAQTHPQSVKSLIIRGVWTGRKAELQFSRGATGTARIYAAEYERFLGILLVEDRADPIESYHKLLQSSDNERRQAAAREWNRWDLTISGLYDPPNAYAKLEDDKWALTYAMLETHYFVNGGVFKEGQLLLADNIQPIKHLPGS